MVQILEADERPSFGQRISQGIGQGLGFMERLGQQRQQADAMKRLTGQDLSGLPPEMQKAALSEMLKTQGKESLQSKKLESFGKLFGKESSVPSLKGRDSETAPREFSDEEIFEATLLDHDLGKAMQHSNEMNFKRSESERDFGEKKASKYLEQADKLAMQRFTKEGTLNAMEDAIRNQDLSFFSWDNLAEKLGTEWGRSAKGGQFKTASKNFFVNNVGKFGSRPNMFIEQKIEEMLPRVGRSQEANLASLELMKFENDIENQFVDSVERLENEFMETKGRLPPNFKTKVNQEMKKYVDERQKQLADRLKEISAIEKIKAGEKAPVPRGTKLNISLAQEYLRKTGGDRQKASQMAIEDGYDISAE